MLRPSRTFGEEETSTADPLVECDPHGYTEDSTLAASKRRQRPRPPEYRGVPSTTGVEATPLLATRSPVRSGHVPSGPDPALEYLKSTSTTSFLSRGSESFPDNAEEGWTDVSKDLVEAVKKLTVSMESLQEKVGSSSGSTYGPLEGKVVDTKADADRRNEEEWHELVEKYKGRLEAENQIGVVAALLAGFSLTMLTEVDAGASASSNHSQIFLYLNVLSLAMVGGLNMLNVVITSFVFFAGHRILSKTSKGAEGNVKDFQRFWDNGTYAFLRRLSRDYFVLSIPLYLFSVAVHLVESMPPFLALLASATLVAFGSAAFLCSTLLSRTMGAMPFRAATVESFLTARWLVEAACKKVVCSLPTGSGLQQEAADSLHADADVSLLPSSQINEPLETIKENEKLEVGSDLSHAAVCVRGNVESPSTSQAANGAPVVKSQSPLGWQPAGLKNRRSFNRGQLSACWSMSRLELE